MFNKFCINILVLFYLFTKSLAADNEIEKLIKSSIKADVEPCDDFYSHACGNFYAPQFNNSALKIKSYAEYNEHQYKLDVFQLLDTYDLEENKIPEHCQSFVGMVRKYFNSCVKIAQRNLRKYLYEISPGPNLNWPILEEGNNSSTKWPHNLNFDLFSLMGKLQSYGLRNTIVVQNVKITKTEFNITLEPMEFSVKNNFATNNNYKEIVVRWGIKDPAKFINEVTAVHNIWISIIEKTKQSSKDKLYITIADLEKQYPNLNFKSYFSESLNKYLPTDTVIKLTNPDFFQYLNDNLWQDFDKEQLCSYIMAKFFFLSLSITNVEPMTCINELLYRFDLAVNFLYYHHIFRAQNSQAKQEIEEIFKVVIDMLGKHFKSYNLKLSKLQIELLMKKLKFIRLYLGNMPENVSCEKVKEFYSSVPTMDENNFYQNHLIMLRFFKSLDYMPNDPYHIPSMKVNIESSQNLLRLPFDQLMPPLYNNKFNSLSKYSILGYFIAQEVIRYCNLNNLNDSTGKLSQLLENYIKCLGERKSGQIIYTRITDYLATEVVRKIVILKFLYLQPVVSVPLWKVNFYSHLAQNFCNTANSGLLFTTEAKNVRLNNIVKHSEVFAKIFQCPAGSKMNPSKKCQLF